MGSLSARFGGCTQVYTRGSGSLSHNHSKRDALSPGPRGERARERGRERCAAGANDKERRNLTLMSPERSSTRWALPRKVERLLIKIGRFLVRVAAAAAASPQPDHARHAITPSRDKKSCRTGHDIFYFLWNITISLGILPMRLFRELPLLRERKMMIKKRAPGYGRASAREVRAVIWISKLKVLFSPLMHFNCELRPLINLFFT